MNTGTKFIYEDNIATCILTYKGAEFRGVAYCHPDDEDFASERVGLSIAECRANIAFLRHIRDNEIKSQLRVLNHLIANMKNSKHYNPISYEMKMLRSQVRVIEKDLAAINNAIADERKFLKDYIDGKDKLFKKLRAKNQ